MAQTPTASFAAENNRRDASAAILAGYNDSDVAAVLSTARSNGWPGLGKGTNTIANASCLPGIIGGINT